MEPVYVKRFINSKADLPKEHGIYLTEFGWLQFNGKWEYPQRANVAYTRDIDWWLEPVEMPTEEEIINYALIIGANWFLRKLK
jgi:hypothetical protein